MPMRQLFFIISLFSCCLASAQLTLKGHNKLSQPLKTLLQIKQSSDSLQLIVCVKDAVAFQKEYGAVVISKHSPSQTFVLQLPKAKAEVLINNSNVLFADVKRQPKEELTTGSLALSVNQISYMHHRFPAYKGQSIKASVKEQQFDSTDIDFKGRYFNSGVSAASSSSHASIMATMLGGGGNSSTMATGAAPGVLLTGSSFLSLLPDGDEVYLKHGISVQNHSYGTDIENYYGADARAFDFSVFNNPSLVHVFSSGNKGTSAPTDGTYKVIEGFANITGSFKMSKNSITVGAVDSFANVVPLSSRGPTYDGRIKPEIVAYGLDGSSGAAALVSGVTAVLQQAYQSVENSLPTAALMKSVLVNSADDKGAPQVDFSYGFGNLNAYNALTTILEKRYWQDSVGKRENRRFFITVPEGMAQLKVTLSWIDPPAEANAPKALINDLDATLVFGAQSWQPWILNHSADKAALQQLALRGKDTLNNIEQITVENPVPGTYELMIDGNGITTNGQAFAIAYQVDTAQQFYFTYPTSSNALVAGSAQVIKWKSTFKETADLEYSLDGNNWQTIKNSVPLQKENETFLVPDINGKILIRARLSSSQIFYCDTIAVTPETNLKVGLNCADSVLLYWNKTGAADYQLYVLGEKYMEPVRVVIDTFAIIHKSIQPNLYYAVAPRLGNQTGNRSMTLNYTAQGVGCYVYSFYATKAGQQVQLDLQLGTLYNVQKIEYQVKNNQKGFETFYTDATPIATQLQALHSASKEGVNLYRAAITTASGAVVYTSEETIYHFTNKPVIVFPNPARQAEPVRILAEDLDVYSIQVTDATGRIILTKLLENYNQTIPPLRLSKGVYFIRIWTRDKKYQTQKLVVY